MLEEISTYGWFGVYDLVTISTYGWFSGIRGKGIFVGMDGIFDEGVWF
jgi:hypothetical protein